MKYRASVISLTLQGRWDDTLEETDDKYVQDRVEATMALGIDDTSMATLTIPVEDANGLEIGTKVEIYLDVIPDLGLDTIDQD